MRKKTPMDSGWSWVILLAAFMDLLLAGIMYCTGVFNVVFLEEFNKSKALTSWCGGLQASLLNLGGLLASLMADRLGTRKTILIGGALVVFGFVACSFATTFIHVFICYGFIAGLGLGIVYTPAIVIIGSYFSRYRNLAYGIVTMGIGVGTMSFAPLVNYLVEEYTWKGAMLIMAAIFTHFFVVGALMRPPHTDIEELTQIDDDPSESIKFLNKDNLLVEKPKHHEVLQNPHVKNMRDANKTSSLINIRMTKDFLRSTVSLHSNGQIKRSLRDLMNLPNNYLSTDSLHSKKFSTRHPQDIRNNNTNAKSTTSELKISIGNNDTLSKPTANQTTVAPKEDKQKQSKRWYLNGEYISYVVNLFFVGIGISCLYVHFPAYVMVRGTSAEKSSTLVSVMGFGSIIGRLGIGAITNKWLSMLTTSYVGSCLLTGCVCILGPLVCATYIGQVLFSFLFAMLANCFIALMAPMCIHTAGLENLNMGYGVAIVICGVGYLVGPPIAGLLFDLTSSYVGTFLLAGFCYAFGGIFMMVASLSTTLFKKGG